ncbi:MAG: glycoside hydrolase 3 protein [Icmadophila ericetorum]|nr:glycoside hydrolase 3 protein [Icmadophila ericetorum]
MHVSSIVSLVAALLPLAVSAKGNLGFALGDKLADGSCKATSDYEADFDALKSSSSSTLVRTYSASECNSTQQILPAAISKGFQVVLGVWPDTDASYAADKSTLQSVLSDSSLLPAVYAITVGSEVLYRGSLTAQQLLSKIQDMQSAFPKILIGTADSWNKFQDGTADPIIQAGLKLVLANAFSYWQGQTIQNATKSYLDDLFQAFSRIQTTAGTTDIEIWTGETGWPSDGGSNYGAAIAGTSNAAEFFNKGVCSSLDWGFNVFYFEAFDEPWKPASVGQDGASENENHWGAFTVDRQVKFPLTC